MAAKLPADIGAIRIIACGNVVSVYLVEFVAVSILAEDETSPFFRLIYTTADVIGEKGELSARAAGKFQRVNLRGFSEIRADHISRFVGCQLVIAA